MAINKNFVVKNGLEVNTNQIFADSATGKVGIGSTLPTVELDVQGAIAATDVVSSLLRVTGYATFSQVQVNNNINVSGFSTVSNELNVLGMSSVTNFKVTGVSTFNENVTFDKDVRVAGFSTFVGVSTFNDSLSVIGIATFYSDIDVDGHTELDNVNISGVTTFASSADFNASIDVDGHTELDITNISETLNVIGVSTFGSDVDINADIDVDGHTELDDLNVSGFSTFASNVDINSFADISGDIRVGGLSTFVGVGTFQSDLYVGGDLYVTDDLVFDEFTARNGNITGVGTITYLDATDTDITNLAVSGLATVSTLGDVGELVVVGTGDTLTNLGIATLSIAGLNVTGIVTATSFSGSGAGLTGVTASGGGTIGIRSDTNVISTATSTIDFKSTTGTAITAITDVTSGITTVTIQPGISIGLAIALGG